MRSYDLNSYPLLLRDGKISKEETINDICSFIVQNYKVFNLQRFDEDFRSELVITFLENGIKFLDSYNSEIGDFFTYLYCYINSMVTTKLRKLSLNNLKESVSFSESINLHYEKEYKYSKFSYHISEIQKIPYAYKKLNVNEIREILSNVSNKNKDKTLLVLAMKSVVYLTDNQIEKICNLYNLTPNDFYKVIEYLKETIQTKINKREKAKERRNHAYYHHKKYTLEINKLSKSEDKELFSVLSDNLLQKKHKHDKNWLSLNSRLEKGFLYLRPTTKVIAEILGICERQVNYLLNCAKKEVKELQEKEKHKI